MGNGSRICNGTSTCEIMTQTSRPISSYYHHCSWEVHPSPRWVVYRTNNLTSISLFPLCFLTTLWAGSHGDGTEWWGSGSSALSYNLILILFRNNKFTEKRKRWSTAWYHGAQVAAALGCQVTWRQVTWHPNPATRHQAVSLWTHAYFIEIDVLRMINSMNTSHHMKNKVPFTHD